MKFFCFLHQVSFCLKENLNPKSDLSVHCWQLLTHYPFNIRDRPNRNDFNVFIATKVFFTLLIFNLHLKLMMLGVSLRKFCYFETDNRMVRLITMGVVGISRCEEIWFEMFSSDKTTFPIFFVSTWNEELYQFSLFHYLNESLGRFSSIDDQLIFVIMKFYWTCHVSKILLMLIK